MSNCDLLLSEYKNINIKEYKKYEYIFSPKATFDLLSYFQFQANFLRTFEK